MYSIQPTVIQTGGGGGGLFGSLFGGLLSLIPGVSPLIVAAGGLVGDALDGKSGGQMASNAVGRFGQASSKSGNKKSADNKPSSQQQNTVSQDSQSIVKTVDNILPQVNTSLDSLKPGYYMDNENDKWLNDLYTGGWY